MEEEILKLLKTYHLTITTAESCTGGLIAAKLINMPGMSSQLEEGYITYSNAAKERLLHVSHDTLSRFGAVSSQTAEEMARGARKRANADLSIVSTGIAGPDGGTDEKPVGLVYLGCCLFDTVKVERHLFTGGRQEVRQKSAEAALSLVKTTILDNEEMLLGRRL